MKTFLFLTFLMFSVLSSKSYGGYTIDQMNSVVEASNSKVQLADSSEGCFVGSSLAGLLASGVEITFENCQYDVPTLIKLSKLGKVKLITNSSKGCYIGDQLRDILSSGIEVTIKTCQYRLSTMLELSQYGSMKLVANNGVSSWPITDLMLMSKAGIDIIFH